MKVAVIGANGQLGADICLLFQERGADVLPLTHAEIDIAVPNAAAHVFGEVRLDWVINTAAFHHVPRCEEDPQRAFAVNALGARNLAGYCDAAGISLLHISTDYVFDGKKAVPYIETDSPHPLNVYGNTKLSGELFIEAMCERHCIVRVSGIYGKHICRAKGGNFVSTMLKLSTERKTVRVVDDEVLTPTATEDIAGQIFTLLDRGGEFGLYHVTAEGSCSWFEFAKEIFSIRRIPVIVERAEPGEFDGGLKRPKYSVLENRFLKAQNLNVMPDWRTGLRRFLSSIP